VEVTVEQASYDDPHVQRLVDEVQAEYVERYGGPDESPMDTATFAPPSGRFFVVLRDAEPVAMGGWRLRPDVTDLGATRAAEVKRMYVAPAARRSGLARLVLRSLEDSAREDGCDLMVMETGLMQPEAIELYESAGYVPVTPFGFYKDAELSRYYGRRLVD
jgi:ribosomal protein S18 acetylase RimI-like enzyme